MDIREKLIKAAEEFYLNKDHGLHLTDLEYDNLLEEVKKSEPDFDIFKHLTGTTGITVKHSFVMPPATKTKIDTVDSFVFEVSLSEFMRLHDNKCNRIEFIAVYSTNRLQKLYFIDVVSKGDKFVINDLNYKILPQLISISNRFSILGSAQLPIDENGTFTDITISKVINNINDVHLDLADIKTAIAKTDYYVNINVDPSYVIKTDQINFWTSTNYVLPSIKLSYVFTPKMDGCSLVVYYKDGKLDYIASRSNDITGKCKTEYLRYFFPNELIISDVPGTKVSEYRNFAIMCECVIDLDHGMGWNSRQRANGLINSKYKLGEVSRFLTFMAYDCINLDSEGDDRIDLRLLAVRLHDQPVNNAVNYVKSHDQVTFKNESDIKDYITKLTGIDVTSSYITKDSHNYGNLEMNELWKLPNNRLAEGTTSMTEIILNGLWGYKVTVDDQDYLIFPNILLRRPKVSTVDYFTVNEFNERISPECQAYYIHRLGGRYLMDGLVCHEIRNVNINGKMTAKPFHNIFKWTYNEVATTTVKGIEWQESMFGTYIPNIRLNTVLIEGSNISRVASGGLSKLVWMKCGEGSEVDVVRVNSTIPAILRVNKTAPINLPKCPHCGRQLTWSLDVYNTLGGARLLKCSDPHCCGKIKANTDAIAKYDTININNIIEVLTKLIRIEAYSVEKNIDESVKAGIINSIKTKDKDLFLDYLVGKVFTRMNRDKQNGFDNWFESAWTILINHKDLNTVN